MWAQVRPVFFIEYRATLFSGGKRVGIADMNDFKIIAIVLIKKQFAAESLEDL